ncbi:MAG TPA: hypothetical protein VKD90_17945 [Gemmataceae bacterium]|nr:hypothetical protein [Gemmataceae bacterium]
MRRTVQRSGWKPAALAAAGILLLLPAPAHASQYWHGFKKFWSEFFQQQSGVVMTVLLIGVISLIIITRGKWRK